MARILVIEDDAAGLELMAYLLNAFGHVVVTATDGQAGLASARRELPDLILCDIQMPTLDGLGVVTQLKADAQLRAIPCIAVTAFAMVGDRDRILAAGFDGYIAKPIQPETFVGQAEAFFLVNQTNTAPAADSTSVPTSNQAGSTPASAARLTPPPRARILVVDNSPNNLEFLRSLFELSGYAVVTVAQVATAVAQARQQQPDLIVCDLHLQDESGLDFLRLIRSEPHLSHLPFIIISSTSWQRKDQLDALAMGASKFILRPIEPVALLAEIEAYLKPMSSASSPPDD